MSENRIARNDAAPDWAAMADDLEREAAHYRRLAEGREVERRAMDAGHSVGLQQGREECGEALRAAFFGGWTARIIGGPGSDARVLWAFERWLAAYQPEGSPDTAEDPEIRARMQTLRENVAKWQSDVSYYRDSMSEPGLTATARRLLVEAIRLGLFSEPR